MIATGEWEVLSAREGEKNGRPWFMVTFLGESDTLTVFTEGPEFATATQNVRKRVKVTIDVQERQRGASVRLVEIAPAAAVKAAS